MQTHISLTTSLFSENVYGVNMEPILNSQYFVAFSSHKHRSVKQDRTVDLLRSKNIGGLNSFPIN